MDVRVEIMIPSETQFEELVKNYIKARDELQKFLAPDFLDANLGRDFINERHNNETDSGN